MTDPAKPWGPWGRALLALLLERYSQIDENQIGSLFKAPGDDIYVRLERVGGRSGRLSGEHVFDVEVFSADAAWAESASFDIEAILLGYPHQVEVDGETFVFDSVFQNEGPHELPWEDDEVSRLGATYVITARRR